MAGSYGAPVRGGGSRSHMELLPKESVDDEVSRSCCWRKGMSHIYNTDVFRRR